MEYTLDRFHEDDYDYLPPDPASDYMGGPPYDGDAFPTTVPDYSACDAAQAHVGSDHRPDDCGWLF